MSDPSDFPPDPAKKVEGNLSREQELAAQLKNLQAENSEVHPIYEHPDISQLGTVEAPKPSNETEDRAAEQTEEDQDDSEKDRMTEEQLKKMEQNLKLQASELREQAAKLAPSFESVVSALRAIVGRGENPALEQLYVDTTTGLTQMELSAQEIDRDGRLLESGVAEKIDAKQYQDINARFTEAINTISGSAESMTDVANTLQKQVDRFFEQNPMPDQKAKQDGMTVAIESAKRVSAEFKSKYNT